MLITDALCYSATDIFAAGFQDNKVGKVLGVNENTGAGGANVWDQELLLYLMGGRDSPLEPLENRGGMRVSIRRLLRVNAHEGMPLEDLGIKPDFIHKMTKADLLNNNKDLINHAASILAQMPVHDLSIKISKRSDGGFDVKAETKNITRLDVYVDDRPQQSLDISSDIAEFILGKPPAGARFIEFRCYKDADMVIRQRLRFE
jgi:C-terminal processing protease CtpA/Prc